MSRDSEKISMKWLQGFIKQTYSFYSEDMGIGAKAFLNDLRNLHLFRDERIEWDFEDEDSADDLDDVKECRWDDEVVINGSVTTCCSKHPNCENSASGFLSKQRDGDQANLFEKSN